MIDYDAMVVSNCARIIHGNYRAEYGICQQNAEYLLNALKCYSDLRIIMETGDCAYSYKPVADYKTILSDDLAGIVKNVGVLKFLVHIDNENTLALVHKQLTEDLYYTIANGYLMQIMSKSATK